MLPGPVLDWTYKTGDIVDSSPAIDVNSRVYAGSKDGYLYALNKNAQLLWKFETFGPITSSPAIGPGGTIYVGSEDSRIYAVGGALCPLSTLLNNRRDAHDTFRQFRDNIIKKSKTGRFFCRAYYTHAEELITILTRRPELQAKALSLTETILEKLHTGSGITLSAGTICEAKTLIEEIQTESSPALARIADKILQEIQEKTWLNTIGIQWKN